METPLRGRSGGHPGAAPTISRMAPCPKVAGEVLADGQTREKVAGEVLADGLSVWFIAGKGFVRRDDSKVWWQTGLCRRDDGAAKRCSAAR